MRLKYQKNVCKLVEWIGDRIDALKDTFVIADETMKNAKENIVLSLGLKFVLLLLSAFGWVPMWVAVFGDMGVTLVAIANALRLR